MASFDNSRYLPGAKGIDSYFLSYERLGGNGPFEMPHVSLYLPDDYKCDHEQDVIVGPNGALFDAYDLSGYDIETQDKIAKRIQMLLSIKFLGYKFEVVRGL